MSIACPRCDYQVSEDFVFCPRCAKLIWPHLKQDIPRRLKTFGIILGGPTLVGFFVGLGVWKDPMAAAIGAGFGAFVGMFVIFAGNLFDAWD